MAILSQKKTILVFGLLVLVNMMLLMLFSLPGLPFNNSSVTSNAPDMQIPDMMLIYSVDYVYDFLTAIGPTGRETYQLTHLTIDLSYPILFSLFFAAVIGRFVHLLDWPVKTLPVICLFSGVFDLAENFTLVYITHRFPEYLPNLSKLSQTFTLGKISFIAVNFTLAGYLAIKVILHRSNA